MNLHPFSALLPHPAWLAEHPGVLLNAKTDFAHFLRQGLYHQLPQQTYYILRITDPKGALRYGIGGLAHTEQYDREKGHIQPHELTLKAREEKQQLDYRSSKHLIKPILLTCPDFDELQQKLQGSCAQNHPQWHYEPEPDFLIEIFTTDPHDQSRWQAVLDRVPIPVAVADGHHRISAARLLMNEITGLRMVPVVLIPANSLGVGAFIRSIKGVSPLTAFELLKDHFSIRPVLEEALVLPAEKGNWLLYNQQGYFTLTAKNDGPLTDPEWFDRSVLTSVFQIMDSRADDRLATTAADLGLASLSTLAVDEGQWHFFPPPISEADFFDKISSRGVFPPKSTRFYPRIPSGLLVYDFSKLG